ncbi:UDP-N-acetylmuramate dehydrogenase [Bacillus marinisedimentorum]|uniref:UDP-N-acetylmuramate dehydrogenase n=1 Tax=Bacillus marinisedimentorum TaxID=1821260 RepID=UPI00087215DC|nr:UDP-N-acetylmuramate dehydrogenase [Bacillus marinisedimentorum]
MQKLIEDLKDSGISNVKENEPLANHTTIKIGGPADVFIEPESIDQLKKTLEIVKKHGVSWRAIGKGSNLLVNDSGIEGAVIKLGDRLDHLEVEGNTVRTGGGYSLIKLAAVISRKGLAGLQFAGGIPGSVGGAVYMNAGAHGSDVSRILKKARILYPDGTLKWLTNNEMEFSYRTSILQEQPGICVEAVFELEEGDKDSITAEMKKHKDYRRDTQPWDNPCAGSIFRNPLPDHAGHLIEKAGLKGYKIGGAQISEKHGNFIVNAGGAGASDVLDLINHVKKTISERYGIKMETEVEIINRNR